MKTEKHHLKLNLRGIVASADLHLTPGEVKAIQSDRARGEQFASKAAIAAMTECQRSNPRWPEAAKTAFATDAADAISACVHAMK